MISSTHKRSIERLVKKIDDSTFDENDIKLLLIDIRDLINPASFIKELAHFIAHPQRNQGLCYQDLNLRALILKQISNSSGTPPLTTPQDILIIKKDLFEIVFGRGIVRWGETLSEEQKKVGFKEKQIKAFVNKAYTFNKKNNTYVLNNVGDIQDITTIIHNCTAVLVTRPLITATALIEQLNEEVSGVFKLHIPDKKYNDSVLAHARDIIICLFCLLRDAQFHVFDGSNGHLHFGHDYPVWSSDWNPKGLNEASADEEIEIVIQRLQNARLSMMFHCEVNHTNVETGKRANVGVISEFISSDILLGEYIEEATLRSHAAYGLAWDKTTNKGEAKFEALLDDVSVERNASGKLVLFK